MALISRNLNEIVDRKQSFVNKIAARIADFAGSVPFVIFHGIWFGIWVVINLGFTKPLMAPFDPFPFGLLTMAVSLEAIFLSTFIMINQNFQDDKNRLESQLDFEVNKKAELEINDMQKDLAGLHEKMDKLHEHLGVEVLTKEK